VPDVWIADRLLLSFARTALLSAVLGCSGEVVDLLGSSVAARFGGRVIAHSFIATIALILAFRTLLFCIVVIFARRARNGSFWRPLSVLLIGVTLARFNWIALVTLHRCSRLIYWRCDGTRQTRPRPIFSSRIDARFPGYGAGRSS